MPREGVVSVKLRLYRNTLATLMLIAIASTACAPGRMPEPVPCDTLPLFTAEHLAFDRDGDLWLVEGVAKPPKGIVRLDPAGGLCAHITKEDGLADNEVLSIASGPDGDLWFGTIFGAISRFDGRRWTTYDDYFGSNGEGTPVLDIAVAPDGTLWFGAVYHAYHFDGRRWTRYTYHNGLPDLGVTAVAAAPDGTIWFGGTDEPGSPHRGGVTRLNGRDWTSFYAEEDGLASNAISDIAIPRDGTVWLGTDRGVSCFDGEVWDTYTDEDGLAGKWVREIAVGSDGALWFATEGGVSRFDGEHWTTYTEEDGLVSTDVHAIAVAPDGKIWAGMTGGVSRFDGKIWTPYAIGEQPQEKAEQRT